MLARPPKRADLMTENGLVPKESCSASQEPETPATIRSLAPQPVDEFNLGGNACGTKEDTL